MQEHIVRSPTKDRHLVKVPESADDLARQIVAIYKTNAGQTITNNSPTVVDFEDKDVDTNTAVTVGASWQFKAPRAGTYLVSVIVTLNDFGAGPDNLYFKELWLRKNAANLKLLARDRKEFYEIDSLNGCALVPLVKNDTIDITITQVSAASRTVYNNAQYNHINIVLVAP